MESLFERLLKQKPDYNFLRTFGCAVWPNLRPYNSRKLAFRSTQCVFLGYSSLHKGYKCLDPKSERVYISRDVVFDEHVFPFPSLHPNAGARLRKDIELLPDLFSSSTSLGNVNSLHQHLPSPASSNSSSSSFDVAENVGENPPLNGEETGLNSATMLGYLMCSPAGDSAPLQVDSPAPAHGGAAGGPITSSSGLVANGSASAADPATSARSSVTIAAPHLSTPPSSMPQIDPMGGDATSMPTPTEILATGSSTAVATEVAPTISTSQQPSTRLSQGISKPKLRTDGTVRWCMHVKAPTREPTTLEEALGHKHWVTAMDNEYQALMKNKTWHLVPRPKEKNIVGCKWVYKIKRKADGTID